MYPMEFEDEVLFAHFMYPDKDIIISLEKKELTLEWLCSVGRAPLISAMSPHYPIKVIDFDNGWTDDPETCARRFGTTCQLPNRKARITSKLFTLDMFNEHLILHEIKLPSPRGSHESPNTLYWFEPKNALCGMALADKVTNGA